ncbi:MAG TPA: DinB family protein [Actinomycetota bacterium]|nr:DinB family protein [Actinomycetota bacterium]
MTDVFVEFDVGGHVDHAVQAWTFDLPHWGLCGQGVDEESSLSALRGAALRALASFLTAHGEDCPPLGRLRVVERVTGDELAFARDHRPATDRELERTLQLLAWARSDLIELLDGSTENELDWDDPARVLPSWATWRTPRAMAWHIADTDSRYYLASLGVDPPPREPDLREEMERSAQHVRRVLPSLRRDLRVERRGQVWTTTKVLRRLAWHARVEVDVVRDLLAKAWTARREG